MQTGPPILRQVGFLNRVITVTLTSAPSRCRCREINDVYGCLNLTQVREVGVVVVCVFGCVGGLVGWEGREGKVGGAHVHSPSTLLPYN